VQVLVGNLENKHSRSKFFALAMIMLLYIQTIVFEQNYIGAIFWEQR